MAKPRGTIVVVFVLTLIIAACGKDGDDSLIGPGDGTTTFEEPWPADLDVVLSSVYFDGEGDQEQMPPEQAGPPYSEIVPFPPVDVTRVAVGVEGDLLYMRVDFAGTIPTEPVHVLAEGEVEEQWVRNQGMNIALNTDNDVGTGGNGEGVSGIDIFFAVGFTYDRYVNVYANWGFPDGDLHHQQFHADGELGMGGPGSDYVVVRYLIRDLGSYLPRGQSFDIGSWSEAESFTASGELLYHHFAFDRVIDGRELILPAE